MTAAATWGEQATFDEIGRPLREVTFCVVDLETTGGSPAAGSRITEIGAVKVRAGEVLGEFQTLVNPHAAIPPFIALLTGISDAMVASAPSIEAALPAFLGFAEGCVLVAHNAPFDVGFLKHSARAMDLAWPRFEVLDTAVVARRALTRDEVPNCKLASLARHFHATTEPNHRALQDARATVDVLHGLIARLGNLGVQTVEELRTFTSRVSAAQRRKRGLAEHLPHAPGVYLFRDGSDRVLYVGTSKDLRARVRGYFTASETRSRMGEMVTVAERVEGIVCATALEAGVRELRLIAEHKPRYNRRSRFPERATWVRLTREPWPRLVMSRSSTVEGLAHLGPFSSRRAAERAVAALHETFRIRQCGGRLPRHPDRTPCALAEMDRCLSPCDGSVSEEDYAAAVEALRTSITGSPRSVVGALERRMERLASTERFEEAAHHRDRLLAVLRAATRTQRLAALAGCAEVVAARKDEGRWTVHVVRHGRLAAAGVIPGGADASAWVLGLRASAETVTPTPGPMPAATAEESELILRWLESDGVRLVHLDGEWTCPVDGAARHLLAYDDVGSPRARVAGFDDALGRT